MPTNIRQAVEEFTGNGKPNFPRILNADLQPVIKNAQRSLPKAASIVFLAGIPYALDSFRQFLTRVYLIFNMLDRESTGSEEVDIRLVRAILEHNEVLRDHARRRISTAVAQLSIHLIGSADGICAQSAEFTVLKPTYKREKIKQWTTEYDQLVYLFIFWNAKGERGVIDTETMQGSTKRIRKVLICLMLQHVIILFTLWRPFAKNLFALYWRVWQKLL
jgi:hypothetical protein